MTGYVFAMGTCVACGAPFSFNPNRVPSIRVKGQRRPVCRSCVEAANVIRKERGLEPHTILDGAYDPTPEQEL